MKLVIKIGGHLVTPNSPETVRKYADVLSELRGDGHRLVVVVGGGKEARRYISLARELGASEGACDLLGILLTRANALLLSIALGDAAYAYVPSTLEEFLKLYESNFDNKIIILGGLVPGQSTNAVAALVAETIEADLLINATNVDGVYTQDPRKSREAKLMEEVTVEVLEKMLSKEKQMAGNYPLLDLTAINILKRSKVRTVILNGKDPRNIIKAVRGEKIGTRIVY